MARVRDFLTRANSRIPVTGAAALLAGSYFASALLGLLRDRLLAAHFGIGGTLDAYFAAFSVPDFMFFFLVSGALSVTFIPVLSELLVKHKKKSASELTSSILNMMGIITFIASILIFIFADQLINLVAPSFDFHRHEMAVTIIRIVAVNPFLFAISTVFASVQQTFGRFFFFALAPVLYNLGIIFGIVFLSPTYGIEGVAYGVVIGAVIQLFVQSFGLIGLDIKYKAKIFWHNKGFIKVIKLIIPRSFDESLDQLISVIERAIASGLAVGSIAAYQYAFNLKNMPITLIGTAIATAVFPKISHQAARDDSAGLKRQIRVTIEAMLWLIIPAAVLMVVLRGYIVRLLFGFGDATTASILGWFAAAIIFQSLMRMIARIFYAYQDTIRPLLVSLAAIVINTVLALVLVQYFNVKGLAMAQSAVAIFEAAVLMVLLKRYNAVFITKEMFFHIMKIIAAVAVMSVVTYLSVSKLLPLYSADQGFWTLAPKFLAVCLLSGVTYFIASSLVGLSEARMVRTKVKNFLFRTSKF